MSQAGRWLSREPGSGPGPGQAWSRAEPSRAGPSQEASQDSRGLEGLYLVLILECRYGVYRSEALLMNVWDVNSFCWMLDVWMSDCIIASLYVNFIQVPVWIAGG